MLRLTTMSRLQRAAMPDRCVSVMPAIWSTKASTSSCRRRRSRRAHRDITTDNSNICDWGHGGGESAAPVWPHSDGSSTLL